MERDAERDPDSKVKRREEGRAFQREERKGDQQITGQRSSKTMRACHRTTKEWMNGEPLLLDAQV